MKSQAPRRAHLEQAGFILDGRLKTPKSLRQQKLPLEKKHNIHRRCSMSADESKKFVLKFIEDLSAGNIDAVTAAFADDVSWWLPGSLPVSGTFNGKKAILEDFFGTAFPFFAPDTLSIHVQSAIAEDNAVAVEWIAKASTAKGKTYENFYHVRFDLKDGKIHAVREYLDSLYAKDVLFA
jgi:ketosteroid isomerase-like protein